MPSGPARRPPSHCEPLAAQRRRRLFQCRVLARGVGPAQRRRQHDLHITAYLVPRIGPELERLETAAEGCELIDCLGALITPRRDPSGEAITVVRHDIVAETNV